MLEIPVAHGEGNYFIDEEGLNELNHNDQVLFRYCDKTGKVSDDTNFNGSGG
ncbi:MAG: phosphoribosylformylglycinamidine synthase subunit PurQ [Balneolaceae bacterium]|nr:phosphoribosylformylglycinamidine synthase subunit PurQ [Balneolaceae bacterium]